MRPPRARKYVCEKIKKNYYDHGIRVFWLDEAGTPLLRGMFYEIPEEADCALLQNQYMFGDKYLVAPVMEAGARSRSVYFPARQWRNVDTGDILDGEQCVEVPAPLDVIPVFERIK